MILVTGGAGYIGSHCVYELIRRGRSVAVVDNLQTGHGAAVHPEAELYVGDIRDGDFLDGIFRKNTVYAVIQFAANSLVAVSMQRPLEYYNNNVHGTEVLLSAMERHGVKKIVFSSTAAVYGESENGTITEEDPVVPTNTYGETKLAMEKMMRWCGAAHGLKYTALRYFNVAGAGFGGVIGEDHHPETHLIPLVLQVPLGKRPEITVYGDNYPTPDGTCIRDYIHISDLIEAHLLALGHLEEGGESDVFNLGSAAGFSVLEIIEAARGVTGHSLPSKTGPRRPGDPPRLVASYEKISKKLGWEPKNSRIEDIIASAWQWHTTHPKGYGDR